MRAGDTVKHLPNRGRTGPDSSRFRDPKTGRHRGSRADDLCGLGDARRIGAGRRPHVERDDEP